MSSDRWTFEEIAPGEAHRHRVVREVHARDSAHQRIEVLETESYGRGLFLDGRIQHVAADEHVYSECLVHPAMMLLGGSCRRALCVGAGPGGVVRELLRYPSVEQVVQVEIDADVLDVASDYLPHVGDAHRRDPRFRLEIADVLSYLDERHAPFDLIVNDLSEPLPGAPAARVFAPESIARFRSRLTDHGLYVSWCGSVGPRSAGMAARIGAIVEEVFGHAYRYVLYPQSYGTLWMNVIGATRPLDPLASSVSEIDARLAELVDGTLRCYDGVTHQHLFHLPRDVRRCVAAADADGPVELLVGGEGGP